jgi:hypothetical protein
MNLVGKILRGSVVVAVLTTVISSLAAPAAHADWRDGRGWRDHQYRERVWRDRRYGSRYYYGNRVYVAPPVVYGPPPPGLNLFFNVR